MFLTKRKSILVVCGALMLGSILLAGCGAHKAGSDDGFRGQISVSGSTALLPLLKPAQEDFQAHHDKITVNIAGGGSFTGMNQAAEGSVQIGSSDVALPAEYQDKGLVDHKVVVEPFVFITDKTNPVDNLSQTQLIGILTGKITNWQEVGGRDQEISLIHRAKSSGSRATISDIVLHGQEFTDQAIIQDSNGAVRAAIASTPGSIGYVDAPYADGSVKMLAFDGEAYTPQAVINGKYPLYGYGHMYTKGEATGAVKAFLDYLLSDEFQNTQVEKLGFIPINKISH